MAKIAPSSVTSLPSRIAPSKTDKPGAMDNVTRDQFDDYKKGLFSKFDVLQNTLTGILDLQKLKRRQDEENRLEREKSPGLLSGVKKVSKTISKTAKDNSLSLAALAGALAAYFETEIKAIVSSLYESAKKMVGFVGFGPDPETEDKEDDDITPEEEAPDDVSEMDGEVEKFDAVDESADSLAKSFEDGDSIGKVMSDIGSNIKEAFLRLFGLQDENKKEQEAITGEKIDDDQTTPAPVGAPAGASSSSSAPASSSSPAPAGAPAAGTPAPSSSSAPAGTPASSSSSTPAGTPAPSSSSTPAGTPAPSSSSAPAGTPQQTGGGLGASAKSGGGGGGGSSKAADFIAAHEGLPKGGKAYYDPPSQKNLVSVGYGHQIKSDEYKQGFIQAGNEQIPITGEKGINTTLTPEQAKALLNKDVPEYAKKAAGPLGEAWSKLSEDQKAALTSYAYNTGSTAGLVKQGLKDAILSGDMETAANIIKNGIKTAGGTVLPALAARRGQEAALFASASTGTSSPTAASGGQVASSTADTSRGGGTQVASINNSSTSGLQTTSGGKNQPARVNLSARNSDPSINRANAIANATT
jgi:GH24 family phage-related lysozyme (muramidase)